MISNKTIFISPLDWGLGHATRCVPIIKELCANNKVIIGTTTLNRNFFDKDFPELQKINLPSYNIKYSNNLPVWVKILLQWPKINAVINEEKKILKQIIAEHKVDLVISDNRFGLYDKNVESIFITHQLNVKSPLFLGLANKKNKEFIHQFDKVWVPDHKNDNERLSGKLSDSEEIKIPVEYIGPKSALAEIEINSSELEKYDLLILLSGVEPQRTILENKLIEKFKDSSKKIILVRGSDTEFHAVNKNISVFNFAFDSELKKIILNADTVICRSGYSTLMDLYLLNKKRIFLIPTPGQTEQEYLAQYWCEKFGAQKIKQSEIGNFVLQRRDLNTK
ncbi:MAG: glycosyltransferase [Bacteroidia bacterium]|nr:glycosyltransferase [Bacteroidia bacterium]